MDIVNKIELLQKVWREMEFTKKCIWVIKRGNKLGFASVSVMNPLVCWSLLSLSLLANLQTNKVAEGTEYF